VFDPLVRLSPLPLPLPLSLVLSAGAALGLAGPGRPAGHRQRPGRLPPARAADRAAADAARSQDRHGGAGAWASFTAVPAVSRESVAVVQGHVITTTVGYAAHVPDPATPPAPAPGGAPVVTGVTGTQGAVGSYEVWLTVAFTDTECDVIGGTWSNAGEGMFDFGARGRADLMRNLSCAGGASSLQFARSCVSAGRFGERVRLTDAKAHRGADYAFTFTCG
jgi:hypothetical protein